MKCGCEKIVVVKSTRRAGESARLRTTARKSLKRAKHLSVAPRKAVRAHA